MTLKKTFFYLMLLIGAAFLLPACGGDDTTVMDDTNPTPSDDFSEGVYVINEGPFQTGTGTVTFYDREAKEATSKIYQDANDGEELGNIVQSVTVIADRAYIVVNNSNKIVIANPTTFEKIGEITGLEQPRFITKVSDSKAFISQWGSDGITGSIKVLDIVTNTITNTITTRPGPERMVTAGNFAYVANSGGFVIDSVISKIDITSEEVLTTIQVGLAPRHIVQDKDLNMWVLTGGQIVDFTNPDLNRPGRLAKVVLDQSVLSIETKTGASNLTINPTKDVMYFTMDGWVYEHPISSTSISLVPFIERFFQGLAVDPTTGNIFGADPLNFQQDGEVVIYDASGTQIDQFPAGIIPSNFWFQ